MIDNEYYLKKRLRKEQEYEDSLPVCEHCGETMDTMSFEIDGEVLCLDCVKEIYGKRIA